MPERATVTNRSEKSAEAVVAGDSEGPNEEESAFTVPLGAACIRSPMDRHRSTP